MATLQKGKTFTNGETVTPQKLHELIDLGSVSNIQTADIANAAVTTAKLADASITTAKIADAAVTDAKLATITTAGKVANSATTAVSANTPSAIVARDASGNFSAGTMTGNVVGNADTATRLQTARTINGVAFDGAANITVTAAPTAHTHDDRYYTETEINSLLAGKQAAGSYASASHTHAISDVTNLQTTLDGKAATAHFHGEISQQGSIGLISGRPIITTTNGVLTTGVFGNSSGTFCQGNDTRLSDARVPASHTHSASDINSGTLANARTTATSEATANTIVQRNSNGEIKIGNFNNPGSSMSVNYGEFQVIDSQAFPTTDTIISPGIIILTQPQNSFGDYAFMEFRSTTAIGGSTLRGQIIQSGTNSISYTTSSDYRLKTNIEPLTDAIARLLQIPVHRFNWVADPAASKVDGFLAHEAQAVVPESVTGHKDAVDSDGKPIFQGIDQSKLVPLLVAAVQELAARVAALEAR